MSFKAAEGRGGRGIKVKVKDRTGHRRSERGGVFWVNSDELAKAGPRVQESYIR